MLVLSRKAGQSIIIDHDIIVTFLGHNKNSFRIGNSVRIGVSAPDHVNILREELLSRQQALSNEIRQHNAGMTSQLLTINQQD